MSPHLLTLHGVPTGPALWARLGLTVDAPRLSGPLAEQVAAVVPRIEPDTILLGHDMGGVVAAMAALVRPPRAVILSGTALGSYWRMVRVTAWPGLARYFYDRHGGRQFVSGAVSPSRRAEALAAFPGADPGEMRAIARSMRPPRGLARALAARTAVGLVWGESDRWYPPWLARRLAAATGGPLRFVRGGHFAMWEFPESFRSALDATLQAVCPRQP